MGNCVTVYKSKDPAPMNLSAHSQSPTKVNFVRREHSAAELGSRPQLSSMEHETSFRDLSKTEDNFFDSQPWLESDCEDFFSVNGDSTSNSPNHQKGLREISSQRDKDHSMERAVPQPSPTETKKQLIELFRESFDDIDAVNKDPKSTSRSPYESFPNSVHSREATPYRKEKSAQSAQCCLPSLVRNMSFGERKKRLSPARN